MIHTKAMKRILTLTLILCCLLTCLPITATASQAQNPKLVALTFDDGPSSQTARLLDGLKARGAKATFFMLGSCAQNYPNTVRRMYEEGHQVCSHSYDHPAMTTKSNDQVRWQLNKTDGILDEILSMDHDYIVRPPYGDRNDRVRSVLAEYGSPAVIWSVDPYDWQDRNSATVCNRIVSGTFDGAIILAHDIYGTTVTGALQAIDILQDYGYEFVTLNELYRRRGVEIPVGRDAFYCKPTGTQLAALSKPVLSENNVFGAKEVTMTSVDGADIYYTTDGSNPAYSTLRYEEPLRLPANTTVRAVAAFNLNGSRSEESRLTTTARVLYAPTFEVKDGAIHIINPNEDTELYYTTDGSSVTAESPCYTQPIPLFVGELRYRVMGAGGASPEEVLYLTESGNVFRDVLPGCWYADTVDQVLSLELFKGIGDFRFAPETGVDRSMFVTVLYRLIAELGADVSFENAAGFPDATAQWYADALSWAAEQQIVKGYEDGSFAPEKAISREEMCVMLGRALRWYGCDIPEGGAEFTDSEDISSWALADVLGMSGMDLLKGYEDGSFRPQGTATRAEAAAVLLRAYELLSGE